MKKRKIVVGVCFFVLLAITVAAPIIDYKLNGELSYKSVSSAILLLVGDFLFLIKNVVAYSTADKKTFAVYESEYKDIIGDAFKRPENKKDRIKLLKSIDLYNQNKFNSAAEKLTSLLPKCQLSGDRYAVLMFLGLCYTDMKAYNKAIQVYENLLNHDMSKSDAWSNLGYVYRKIGDFEKQCECYKKSIQWDPNNPYAHNNLAQALSDYGLYEEAIPYAEKALELKHNFHPAASCLATCYCALGDEEKCAHYSKIAVSNGTNVNGLNILLSRIRNSRDFEYNEDNDDE